mgnify:FL=1
MTIGDTMQEQLLPEGASDPESVQSSNERQTERQTNFHHATPEVNIASPHASCHIAGKKQLFTSIFFIIKLIG